MPSPPATVMVTGSGVVQDAVTALKLGAFDYLVKPDDTRNVPKLVGVIRNAVAFARSEREIVRLNGELAAQYRFENIVGNSRSMDRVFNAVDQVADSDVSVLIIGESGTGKELIARAIHYASMRAKGPFVPVNCAAIPETLIESELFGHEKGAFTGAFAQKRGKFELAAGGTIFLDEIGDMNVGSQTRLLRVLQDKMFERVGGTQPLHANARVIAATNRDLRDQVEKSAFRLDLYYRVSVFPIALPPLREKPEDIPILAAHFLHEFAASARKKISGFEPPVMNALLKHPWHGNVRELRNAVQHAVVMADESTIRLAHLPPDMAELGISQIHLGKNAVLIEDPATNDIRPLNEVEQEVIRRAMEATEGNYAKAAQKLQISRATLYRKMKEYHLGATQE
jgi:two-component system response regulator HydG